jgi:hypothetical protein
MRSWKDESQLRELVGPVPPLSGRMKESLLSYSTIPENSLSNFEPFLDALIELHKELEDRTELAKAALSYSCFIQNLRDFNPESPIAKQLELLHPVSSWLPTMPSKFLGIGTRDIWALVTMAYFNTVLVATAIKLPGIATPSFAIKRTEIILRIDTELHSINTTNSDAEKARQVRRAIALMRLPMLYVVDFRLRHCTLNE